MARARGERRIVVFVHRPPLLELAARKMNSDPLEAVRLMRAQTASCFEKVWRDKERRRGVRTNTRPQ